MRRAVLISGAVLAAVLALLWYSGALALLERQTMDAQRDVQAALAGAIRQLRAGNPGALAALLGVSFAYGFFHAAGPGHGKLLIGGYGMATRVRLLPLASIALAASLAQAAVAVLMVYTGILLLGWTRDRLMGVTEQMMTPLSHAAIVAIGLWLVWRGWRGLRPAPAHHHHDHDHHHHHDEHCGHTHGPSIEQVARLHGWRDAAALIAGIALRPCTGALFVLVLTWQMGIGASGVLAAFAMGLGTASVTLVVAGLSVWAREGTFAALPGSTLARAAPLIEIAVGGIIALVATRLLIAAI
jgi:nickel/cobalt transporter (NicO) family protein